MIPFAPPRIDQKIIDAVVETLRSGWITTGPKTKLFEKNLAEYTGCGSVVCVNSATAGLELVLRWFGVKKGDEVILPAYTYAATANVVVHCGAKPVFVDVNKDDFNISVPAIEKAITSRTKVIMPVDFGGFPCDYNAINALVRMGSVRKKFVPKTAEQKKLGRILVLSDAAHSLGAVANGNRTGKLTDVSVFSFHAVKNLSTAEGGAVALNFSGSFHNRQLYKLFSVKALHGQNKDALDKFKIGNWRYDIAEAGYKCNMTDIAAAIGIAELQRYQKDTLVKRKRIFDLYSRLLSKYDWAELPVSIAGTGATKTETSYHLYPLRIKNINEKKRDRLIREVFNQQVSVNVHFIPVPMMSFYKRSGYNIKNYPVAYDNYSREISLPVFYDLTDKQVKTVVGALVNAVKKVLT